jgi:hypothetical protein
LTGVAEANRIVQSAIFGFDATHEP